MPFVFAAVMILFVVLGVVFTSGKGAFLISGYNMMSAAEKSKINELKLCRFMGRYCFALALAWSLTVISGFLKPDWLIYLGIAAFLIVCIGGVIYANTGNRFNRSDD